MRKSHERLLGGMQAPALDGSRVARQRQRPLPVPAIERQGQQIKLLHKPGAWQVSSLCVCARGVMRPAHTLSERTRGESASSCRGRRRRFPSPLHLFAVPAGMRLPAAGTTPPSLHARPPTLPSHPGASNPPLPSPASKPPPIPGLQTPSLTKADQTPLPSRTARRSPEQPR